MYALLLNCSQSVGGLQADAFGVMNQLARIIQQPALGMLGLVLSITLLLIILLLLLCCCHNLY